MRPARAGFTLVELLVSLVLIEVALLAIAGTSAMVVREADAGRARAAAVRVAVDRLEMLSARTPCAASVGETTGARGVHERWTVALLANGTRELSDTVTYPQPHGWHTITLGTRGPC